MSDEVGQFIRFWGGLILFCLPSPCFHLNLVGAVLLAAWVIHCACIIGKWLESEELKKKEKETK